jgi:hypothetical protein
MWSEYFLVLLFLKVCKDIALTQLAQFRNIYQTSYLRRSCVRCFIVDCRKLNKSANGVRFDVEDTVF